jgi:TonB-dependent receptor
LSNVQIDGVNLATPQADGRRIDLNVITNDQLERIEVSKTWLPYQKANVIGGTVDLITRSALDRGERYVSFEGAATYREIQEDETSWRGSLTYGDVLDKDNLAWLGDSAIGFQISVNQSEDFSGSDTISWVWNLNKDYPYRLRQGEERPRGFTLEEVNLRDFNIQRDRLGASAKLEFRLNNNHEFKFSLSHNEFDDLENEHVFNQDQLDSAQFFSGIRFLSQEIMDELNLDPNDPFNQNRLGGTGLEAALTYNEALALGEIGYNPENFMFTNGGNWPMPSERTYIHTERNDEIDTFKFEGIHHFPREIEFDWKVYTSEAQQQIEMNWLRFEAGNAGGGGRPRAGEEVQYPFFEADEGGANEALYDPVIFQMQETEEGTDTVRQLDTTFSIDDREGFEGNLSKQFDVGTSVWTIRVGYAADYRDKSFEENDNSFGIRTGGLDDDFWDISANFVSLADEFFDGGVVEGFDANFGENLRFGPTFHEMNTLAMLKDPENYGITFGQSVNHLNDNVTTSVSNNFDASEDITAWYYQQSIEWRKWEFIFGFRYENTDNTFTNLNILTRNPEVGIPFIQPALWKILRENFGDVFSEEVTSERSYDYFLPAFHIIRNIGERTTVRASATKTIARPLFSDPIAREVPGIDDGKFQPEIRLPAFDLKPMESINYDISVDHYLEPIGLFSVAFFYKDLEGPIFDEVRVGEGPNDETAQYELKYNPANAGWEPGDNIVNNNSYTFRQKRNAGPAELFGFEITFNKRLNFLPGIWNGFGIDSNFAWFDSMAELPTAGRVGEEVQLFKQPDITANFSLFYEKYGIFARLSYNVRGKYLDTITAGSDTLRFLEQMGAEANGMDTWVDQTAKLDFTLRYKVTPNIQLFFEGINLTNEPEVRIRGDAIRPSRVLYTERVFTGGVKWNF